MVFGGALQEGRNDGRVGEISQCGEICMLSFMVPYSGFWFVFNFYILNFLNLNIYQRLQSSAVKVFFQNVKTVELKSF